MASDLERDQLIDSFLSNLRLEKGLSENTIKAYSSDCYTFKSWLLVQRNSVLKKTDEDDIKLYLKKKDFYSHLITKMYHKCLNFHFLPHFLSANSINIILYLYPKI